MKTFRINAQGHIIDDIIEHLENGHAGMGIARDWDYTRDNDTLIFTLKEGSEVKPADLFWFGYLTKD